MRTGRGKSCDNYAARISLQNGVGETNRGVVMVRAIIFGLWRGADKLPLVPPRLVTDVRMKDELKILKGK